MEKFFPEATDIPSSSDASIVSLEINIVVGCCRGNDCCKNEDRVFIGVTVMFSVSGRFMNSSLLLRCCHDVKKDGRCSHKFFFY